MLPPPPGEARPPNCARAAAGAIVHASSRPPEKMSPAFDNSMSSRLASKSSMKMAPIASIRSRAPLWALAFAVVAAAIGATLAVASAAQSLPDNILIPNYSPGTMPFHPGEELVYEASWIGVPAAGGRVVLRPNPRDPRLLHAEIEVSTNRLIDRFYKMRDYLDEDFTAGSLMPATMQIRQNEGRRHDTFNVTFD